MAVGENLGKTENSNGENGGADFDGEVGRCKYDASIGGR
jgi:hypothetical protein